jgi:hypothetical protein
VAQDARDATTSMSPAPTRGGDYSHHDLRTRCTCWEAIFTSGDDDADDGDDRGDSDGDNQKEKSSRPSRKKATTTCGDVTQQRR